MDNFAKWCGKQRDSYSGHWDVGHRLELVYKDALNKCPELKKFLKIVEKARGYCYGKDGLILQQLAFELKTSFLSEKSDQKTRWVRSLLRMIDTYFRNLQTIYKLIGNLIESAREEEDITEQKYLTETLQELSNPFYLCFGIGICQVLDNFTELSLGAQKLWQFPGTLVLSIQDLNQI